MKITNVMGGIESIYSTGVTLTAPAGFGMIDNLDQRIAYAGGWANWSESVNYNGSIMYLEVGSYSTDATVTLQFIGTGIEVITCTNHDRSYMEVIIDGVSCGEEQEKPAENPFIDVKESDYFYKAVLWAVEEGIVYGLSSDRFGPYSPCTRAQMVTFLYRLCK